MWYKMIKERKIIETMCYMGQQWVGGSLANINVELSDL